MMNSSSSSLKIPVDLFLEIQLFLDSYDYWILLTTAKKLFEEVRFSTRMIKLNKLETVRLLEEPDFLRLILEKVQSPGRQLSLCMDRECNLHFPVNEITVNDSFIPNWQQLFSLASKLNLSQINDITGFPFFPSLRSLQVRYTELNTVNNFSHLKKLFLRGCCSVVDVNCLQNLERSDHRCIGYN
jgi:hypothetical protein